MSTFLSENGSGALPSPVWADTVGDRALTREEAGVPRAKLAQPDNVRAASRHGFHAQPKLAQLFAEPAVRNEGTHARAVVVHCDA